MFSKATREARDRNKIRRASDAVTSAANDGTSRKDSYDAGSEDKREDTIKEDPVNTRREFSTAAQREKEKERDKDNDCTLPKEVTSVMDAVRVNWDFMSNTQVHSKFDSSIIDRKQFNPVPHALSLLDSSHGLDIKKFYSMHEKLEQTMDVIVNDYHQAFNDSIQTFSAVVENISDSQKRVSDMKSELDWCKELLQSRKFDVFPLWVKSIQYKEMMHILDTMYGANSHKVPDKIESLIGGKFFFMAVTTLMSSLAILNAPEYQDIGALSNIRIHLIEVAETLHETLIDELNNHIYLKSPHSLDRIGVLLDELESRDNLETTRRPEAFTSSTNLLNLEDHKLMEDLDVNPEIDSFNYMKVLVECLDMIDRLPAAVEVKSLLYDYLTRTSRTSDFESAIVSMNDILKEKRSLRGGRDENVKIFKLSTAPNPTLTAEYLKLNGAQDIQSLSSLTLNEESISTATTGIVDKYANVVSTGHRLLISPDPYNVLIAFKPTMSFVTKIENMVSGKKAGKFTIFLDDFILSVFLPSMEERVLEYFHEFVNGTESFVTDHNQDVAPLPLVKSVVALTVLIQAMCRTLFIMPVHQSEFIKMVEMTLVKFYEKILARYRSLMAGEQLHEDYQGVGIISAGWACEDEVVQLLLKNTYFLPGIPNPIVNKVLAESETFAEMNFKKERSFDRRELIFDSRTLQAVAHMHYSIDWFIAQIGHLRVTEKSIRRIPPLLKPRTSNIADSNTSINDTSGSSESLPPLMVENEDDVQLPLNTEMTNRFDSILNYYQELSETYLFALHVEIRCHAMYYLDLAMREGSYYLENEPYEPDSYINSLNQDLIMIQETVTIALPLRKIRFLYDGLSYLIMHVLSVNLKYIKRINKFGVMKLLRNVESLQQSLTNISAVHEKGLDHVRKYFELLNISGYEMLQYMESHPGDFSFEEYKVVLDLIFQDVLEDASLPKKEYSDCLDGLKTFFVNH
ncbi:UNVERIFIED_CONTAM: hypothetical protein HDU68_001241 [Siphonaria sp. JEL0065]|nr:hypothetical protein HDU68_001241 [Siphonaria sp. JEL0065]